MWCTLGHMAHWSEGEGIKVVRFRPQALAFAPYRDRAERPAAALAQRGRLGVRRVFTPSDYKLTDVVGALIDLCASA